MTREKKTGRTYTPLVQDLEEGEFAAIPTRGGGAFDPSGVRSSDLTRADDVVEIVNGHAGRWLMITLTVDRSEWLSPEAAYQRCNERVREVARKVAVSRVYVTAFELQGKTGGGWPHWHLVVWAPDERAIEEIERTVRKAWRIFDERHEIDEATGELLSTVRTSQAIGIVDVQEARTREGVAVYVSKYVTKPWTAIPPWMGEGRRQLRKLRISRGAFDWLQAVGRHRPTIGSRKVARMPGRCGKRRSLFDRMAASGNSMNVMQRVGERLVFKRRIPVPASGEGVAILERLGATPMGLPDVPVCRTRWRLPESAVRQLSSGTMREIAIDAATARFKRQREFFAGQWAREQSQRVANQ